MVLAEGHDARLPWNSLPLLEVLEALKAADVDDRIGSAATTLKRTVTDTVCDNTRAAALAESGQTCKVKHSDCRRADAREALALIYTVADTFAAEVKQLCATTVSDGHWRDFLNAHNPLVDAQGRDLEGRSATSARLKRAALVDLYRHDPRCAPWAGTAHGVPPW